MPCILLHTAHPADSLFRNEAPPYRQVMGVTVEDTTLWRPNYDKYGLPQPEPFEVSEAFARRLFRFFEVYLTMPRGRTPEYTCHLFAGVVSGSVQLENGLDDLLDQAGRAARNIVVHGSETLGPLPLERHGVIGVQDGPDYSLPFHSVIGLGLESDECLQVNHTYGELGIQQYARNAAHYPAHMKLYA